jgi:hypothetical protein
MLGEPAYRLDFIDLGVFWPHLPAAAGFSSPVSGRVCASSGQTPRRGDMPPASLYIHSMQGSRMAVAIVASLDGTTPRGTKQLAELKTG